MSTKQMPWFRMYTDFLNDPKMISLAFEDQRHFIGLLALKGDGTLDNECAPDLLNRIVAQRLWVDYAVIVEVKKRLMAVGLIDENWQPAAWDKRQMRSDSSTDRVRAHRNKTKQAGNETGNNNETLQKRSSNGLDTEEDTDTEEEQKKDITHSRKRGADASGGADVAKPLGEKDLIAEGVDKQHAKDWLTIRKAKRLPLTPTAWADIADEAAKAGLTPPAAVEVAVKAGWAGFKAAWLQNADGRLPPTAGAGLNKQQQLEQRNREIAAAQAARVMAGAPA
ncbi:hypothetical protein PanNE5_03270 [Pandoraea sp. NE5]|uniref:hypothetical protein n=1 Tax=Pandoraea sp. NE5 TaxID=2904129 RepID=UPI0021C2787C|nr:hypothetical protein [Pandoraea sp. NE5]BDD90887.1 hypothetical protein PanNE5_03270 [Pandoraea sp. NE5]